MIILFWALWKYRGCAVGIHIFLYHWSKFVGFSVFDRSFWNNTVNNRTKRVSKKVPHLVY